MSENERSYSEAAISPSSRLFDQICFAQWLNDTIVDFALVEAVRFLGVNRDSYRSGKVGEVCYGIPCNEKLLMGLR